MIVRYIDLPCTIRGMTVCEHDFYSVYINARLSYEEQQKAVKHELTHINRGDFTRDVSISCIEDMETGQELVIIDSNMRK